MDPVTTVARPHLYLVTHSLTFDGTGADATFKFAASFDGSDSKDPKLKPQDPDPATLERPRSDGRSAR